MKKIGLLSDTHSYIDQKIITALASCDEVWHAGDIGDLKVMRALSKAKVVRAVHGNIDDKEVRRLYPANQYFFCEGFSIWLSHITGTPKKYTPRVLQGLAKKKIDILVGGHTHMLRVERDGGGLLYLNPGAIGKYGIHQVCTLLRFTLSQRKISNMEVVEFPR